MELTCEILSGPRKELKNLVLTCPRKPRKNRAHELHVPDERVQSYKKVNRARNRKNAGWCPVCCRRGWCETGILEMDWITRPPLPAPTSP